MRCIFGCISECNQVIGSSIKNNNDKNKLSCVFGAPFVNMYGADVQPPGKCNQAVSGKGTSSFRVKNSLRFCPCYRCL